MTESKSKLPQPDSHTIERCKEGESEAFRSIVDMYQNYVRRLIFKILVDEEHTKDIAQNSFIKIWQYIKKYDEKYLFSTWMYRIVVNNCYDFLKSQKYRDHHELENRHSEHILQEEDTYTNKDLIKHIRLISRGLPMKQRMVFILKDLQNLSSEEVSEILEMSKGAVKSNLFHARKFIREIVMKLEKQEDQQ